MGGYLFISVVCYASPYVRRLITRKSPSRVALPLQKVMTNGGNAAKTGSGASEGGNGNGGGDDDGELKVDLNLPIGTIVWARVSGYPWWPALIVPYKTVLFLPPKEPLPAPDPTKLVCQFLSDGRISLVDPTCVKLYHHRKNTVPKGHPFWEQIMHACEAAVAYDNCDNDPNPNAVTNTNTTSAVENARDKALEEVITVRALMQNAFERIDILKEQIRATENLNKLLKKKNEDLLAEQNRMKKSVFEMVFDTKSPDFGATTSAAAVEQNADANAESNSKWNSPVPPPLPPTSPPSPGPSSRRHLARNRSKSNTPVSKPIRRNARRSRGGREVSSAFSNYNRRTVSRTRNSDGNGDDNNNNNNDHNDNNKNNRTSYIHTTSSRATAGASGTPTRQEDDDKEEEEIVLD